MPESGLYAPVWREFNRMIEYVRAISPISGRGVRVNRSANGVTFNADIPKSEPGEPGVTKRFTLVSVHNDHLVCDEINGEPGILIAKPFNLRYTGWHGESVLYTLEGYPAQPAAVITIAYSHVSAVYRRATVTFGAVETIEHQVIIPRYIPGKTIIFAAQSENGTGAAAAGVEGWVDLNADARAWARIV
jgi:hypothetical protein